MGMILEFHVVLVRRSFFANFLFNKDIFRIFSSLIENFELKYIYPFITGKTKMFLRFIDDLFMIWTDSEQELPDFMSDLNKKHPSIKFEFKYPQTKIEFLDVLVYKDQNNMLQATIYRKQTDRQNYLDARSKHPKSLKDSIPYSFTDKTNLFFTARILELHSEND